MDAKAATLCRFTLLLLPRNNNYNKNKINGNDGIGFVPFSCLVYCHLCRVLTVDVYFLLFSVRWQVRPFIMRANREAWAHKYRAKFVFLSSMQNAGCLKDVTNKADCEVLDSFVLLWGFVSVSSFF